MKSLTCRHCGFPVKEEEALFVTRDNLPSKKPIHRDCYERIVNLAAQNNIGRFNDARQKSPGYQERIYNG